MSISRIGRPRRCAKSTQGRSGRPVKRGRDSRDTTPIRPPSDPASSCKPGQAAGEPDGPVFSASECIEAYLAHSRTEGACRFRAVRDRCGVPGTALLSPGIPRCLENKGSPQKGTPSLEGGTPGTVCSSSPGSISLSQSSSPAVRTAADSARARASKDRGPQPWGPQPEVLTGGQVTPLFSSVHPLARFRPRPAGPPTAPGEAVGGPRATPRSGDARRLHEGNKAKKTLECVFAFGGPATVGTLPLGP